MPTRTTAAAENGPQIQPKVSLTPVRDRARRRRAIRPNGHILCRARSSPPRSRAAWSSIGASSPNHLADTTLILALAGVGGTIAGTALGAAIAARATLVVERRREQRAERDDDAKLRAAARLVWLDLAQADASLAWAALRGRWSPSKVRLPMEAWLEHRERLAVGIADPQGWRVIAEAMAALAHLEVGARAHLAGDGELPPGIVESIKEVRAAVLRAAEIIAPIAGVAGLQPSPDIARTSAP